MKSIFHNQQKVKYKGKTYKLEADETIEGVQFFRVTDITDIDEEESYMLGRRGNKVKKTGTHYRFEDIPDRFVDALLSSEQVDDEMIN